MNHDERERLTGVPDAVVEMYKNAEKELQAVDRLTSAMRKDLKETERGRESTGGIILGVFLWGVCTGLVTSAVSTVIYTILSR